MNYYDAPQDPPQINPIEPKSIISGALPGATEIRLGNNIVISGKNQQILVSTTGGNVVVGSTSDGRLAMEATNTDGSKVGIGTIPGTTNLGLYSIDANNHTTAVLGKQADGSNSLKFFDLNNIGLAQFGSFTDGSIALKVANTGVEVGSADNTQLIFNSSQNMFKIITTKVIPLTFTRSSTTFASYMASVPHGQTFTPGYQYEIVIDPLLTTIPASHNFTGMYVFSANVGGAYTPFGQAYCTIDATNIYFQIDMSTLATGTYTCTATIDVIQKTFGG